MIRTLLFVILAWISIQGLGGLDNIRTKLTQLDLGGVVEHVLPPDFGRTGGDGYISQFGRFYDGLLSNGPIKDQRFQPGRGKPQATPSQKKSKSGYYTCRAVDNSDGMYDDTLDMALSTTVYAKIFASWDDSFARIMHVYDTRSTCMADPDVAQFRDVIL